MRKVPINSIKRVRNIILNSNPPLKDPRLTKLSVDEYCVMPTPNLEKKAKKTPKATLAPVDMAVLPEAFRMAVSDRGTLMTTPALLAKDGGIDGFFIACLEKAV